MAGTKSPQSRTKQERQMADVEQQDSQDGVGCQAGDVIARVRKKAHASSVPEVHDGGQELLRGHSIHALGRQVRKL